MERRAVDVNPAILAWARTRAGLGLQEAAARFGIKMARLESIENGEVGAVVSRTLFKKMVTAYRQPALVFYLSRPPEPEDYGAEFRKAVESESKEVSIVLESLVRNAWVRQSIVKSTMESEDEARPVSFVGTLSIQEGEHHAVEVLTRTIGGEQTLEDYHSRSNAREAFNIVRRSIEKAGVFVILKGDLGNYLSSIPTTAFRGLAISDKIAPFIVVNPDDSFPARSFTLLHEMVHLLLGTSSISRENYIEETVERFCNRVASHCLLPEEALEGFHLRSVPGSLDQVNEIGDFAAGMNLSGTMVAYRLFLSGRIDQSNFEHLRQRFFRMWKSNKDSKIRPAKSSPSYYVVQRSRLGESLLRFTERMLASDAISTSRAATILDVNPINVGAILDPTSAS